MQEDFYFYFLFFFGTQFFSCIVLAALYSNLGMTCFTHRLYWITKRAGERQGSGLMKANAWHHRADAISSVVALIGVGKKQSI